MRRFFMKIEKIDKDNIKEYIRNLGTYATLNDEKSIIDVNTFGVSEDDRFLFGFYSLPTDDAIFVSFGRNKISEDIVRRCINFLNSNLSFEGHLIIETSDDKFMDIMDNLYRVKFICVDKILGDYENIKGGFRDKYADIDMRSIKYGAIKDNFVCDLYGQNIQNEDVIRSLDEFFVNLSAKYIEFCILPDSLEVMESLGYKCVSKRYVIVKSS